ncbi:MAG: glycine--tRNA ligase [Candidatus Eiseniibacteriota bacterium]|jgi:glycyl-tRNA synthetase
MADLMEKIVSLAKRRGIIYPSSEIYGGLNGCWDYGPLGVELKRNVKEAWWRDMVMTRDDVVGLDSAILMNPRVWEASGHVEGFTDPMVDCTECKGRFRADQLEELRCLKKPSLTVHACCREGQGPGTLTETRQFNMMFKTHVGALEDSSSVAYLRPETAQGIFVNFKTVVDTSRVKLPFGIGQIGKAFRNEINPRNFTFRSREFEQMEIEFFCHPDDAERWYTYWRDLRFRWYAELGVESDRLTLRDHRPDELAHYSSSCADVEYAFPFGVNELEGISYRGDYDLTRHQEWSGKDLRYFDEERREKYVPHVIEPSAGVDRTVLVFLCEAYAEDAIPDDKGKPQPRELLRFHPRIAPYKAAVFPLVKRDGMPDTARGIFRALQQEWNVFYDEKGAIGRRYRRQDEAGTPYCITVDGQTGEDGTVTLRDRDTTRQWRVALDTCVEQVRRGLRGELEIPG